MPKRRKKTDMEVAQGILLGYVNVLDAVFTRATGKGMKDWLEEFRQRPRELPRGAPPTAPEPEMSLSDAYIVLGLAGDAPIEEIKKRYRNLANLFHPDRPGGYKEAMILLNRAYARVLKEKGQ